MSNPKITKKQLTMLLATALLLSSAIGYRATRPHSHPHSHSKPHSHSNNQCEDDCSRQVTLKQTFPQERTATETLAIVLEKTIKDPDPNKVDKHGPTIMKVVGELRDILRVKGQFTQEEQAAHNTTYHKELAPLRQRIAQASATLQLYNGGKHLNLQIGNALNATIAPKELPQNK